MTEQQANTREALGQRLSADVKEVSVCNDLAPCEEMPVSSKSIEFVVAAYTNSFDRRNIRPRNSIDKLFKKHRDLAFRRERGLSCP
jgi:hypothetical protein